MPTSVTAYINILFPCSCLLWTAKESVTPQNMVILVKKITVLQNFLSQSALNNWGRNVVAILTFQNIFKSALYFGEPLQRSSVLPWLCKPH